MKKSLIVKRGVQVKLTAIVFLLIGVICGVFGVTSYTLSSTSMNEQVNAELSGKVDDISKYVSSYMNARLTMLEGVAQLPEVKSMDWETQKQLLKDQSSKLGFDKFAVAKPDGTAHTTLNDTIVDVKAVDYVQACLKGEKGFSNPKKSTVNGKLIMDLYAPLKDSSGNIVGAMIGTMGIDNLNAFIGKMQFSNSAYAYVVNKDGTVILHKDISMVEKQYNAVKEAEKDNAYKELSNIIKEMISGKSEIKTYKLNNKQNIVAFAPVEGVKWFVAVDADKSTYFQKTENLKHMMIIITIVFILLGLLFGFIISGIVTRPLIKIKEFAERLSKYNFSDPIKIKGNDEFSQTGMSLNTAQDNVKVLIKTIMDGSEDMSAASEELSATSEELFSKFETISSSTEKIVNKSLDASAATEEISASMEEINSNIVVLSNKASEGSNISNEIKDRALTVQKNTKNAIDESRIIYRDKEEKIIKAIESGEVVSEIKVMADAIADISERTNLLALNAAIEAARAGEQGRGFAVVAEEVRKLAEQSTNTVATIKDTITKVQEAFKNLSENGQQLLKYIDENVNKQFDTYVDIGQQYYKDAEYISNMSSDLAAMTEEITASINQVSDAVDGMAEGSQMSTESTKEIHDSLGNASHGMEQIVNTSQSQAELAQKLAEIIQRFKI